jgi:hypothetical protein
MDLRHEPRRRAIAASRIVAVVAGLALAACGQDYPSRDWSGDYLVSMVGSSSDCHEAPVPPAMPQMVVELDQKSDNTATLMLNPLVPLEGAFQGDELVVSGSSVEALGLPDTLQQRIQPADSFDTIAYEFRGGFDNWRFRGQYTIRSPDVRALVRGVRPLRCTIRYELTGIRFEPPAISEQPWIQGLEADTAPPAVPADTAAQGDTSAGTR